MTGTPNNGPSKLLPSMRFTNGAAISCAYSMNSFLPSSRRWL